MAQQFYSLKIKDIEQNTPECKLIEFEVPSELKSVFSFQPGQHLTLRTTIGQEEVRRSYSLCSSPTDEAWRVAIKRIEGGLFTAFVHESLKRGDVLEVAPPHGAFVVKSGTSMPIHHAAFAAGSGITPVFAMIKTVLHQQPHARFSLFYINQSVSSIILKEEIEALKNQFLERFEVYHFLTQEVQEVSLFNGRIDQEKLDQIFRFLIQKQAIGNYYLCGPEPMIFMIRDYLRAVGVSDAQIHFELFHSFIGEAKIKERKAQKISGGMVELTVKEGGKTMSFQMAKGSETLLDAALKRNSALPFACKGGVCCTCKARLIEGEVDMEVNYALEKEQLEAGYILTCQAIPKTEKVYIDFDQ